MCGKSKATRDLADYLWTKGIFVLPIFYPMVPRDKARIRVQVCAKHTPEQLDKAAEAFKEGGKRLGII
jgi:2-amino-3-ketobutyrate coenzyme A ligase (EC 2.3.1.29)